MLVRFRSIAVALIALVIVGVLAPSSWAALKAPQAGPFMDGYTGYEGQTKCSPTPKPGVVAFQRMVVGAYPNTGLGGISRACNVGGQSEHKEGRAWDWTASYSDAGQRRSANELIDWLIASDRYGNEAAIARRLGIMYIIWNKRIFFPGSGWRTYCVTRHGACVDPDDHGVRDPHTSHVHFSFTWAGAYKQTTFWHPERTYLADATALPSTSATWSVGGNGGVMPANGAPYLGDKSDEWLDKPAVAITSTPSGNGYWLSNARGKVFAFGDAPRRGSVTGKTQVADMAAHPSGRGYWIVSEGGRVFSFGKIPSFGSAKDLTTPAVGIESTTTGKGYWILAQNGRVVPFGDAQSFGDGSDDAVGMVRTSTGLGYWIATESGRVNAIGDAVALGSLDTAPKSPVTAIVASPTRLGYDLITTQGNSFAFGDALPMTLSHSAGLYAVASTLLDLSSLAASDL
ncbi:MAG: hypothetical protein QOG54_2162 [Actinomycetota bacterium]|nr:hypothetical protein [Actinomycetota bacterium]